MFSELPQYIQDAVSRNKEGLTPEELELLTPEELFEAWCDWHGFINWSTVIHAVHKEIFK